MWPVLAVAAGVVVWRVVRSIAGASNAHDGPLVEGPSALHVDFGSSATRAVPSFAVAWAQVPFDTDSGAVKERPVVILDSDGETVTVLELRSNRGPTTEIMTWVPVSSESARTFDYKHQPGWVKVARPRVLPASCLSQGSRPPGRLTERDARLMWAAMLEYVL